MLANSTKQNLNSSLLKKITLDRRSPSEDIHPLSLIIMDISSFITNEGEYDNKQKIISSAITKKLNYNTRKTDIKTCIHKSKYALFLPNTLESGAHTLSDRIYDNIKKILNEHNLVFQKNSHIIFQISTYLKTSQGKGELEVFNEQYRKQLI